MLSASLFHAERRPTARLSLLASMLALGGLLLGSVSHAQAASLWFQDGRPNAEAQQALTLLKQSADEGLTPEDYAAGNLQQAFARLGNETPSSEENIKQLDGALTRSMQRYLSDLRFGRVDPRTIHLNFNVHLPDKSAIEANLRSAVEEHHLSELVQQSEPPLPVYGALRQALAQYRQLSQHPALQTSLPPMPTRKLQPGQNYSGLLALTQRLIALGDLPSASATPANYSGALVDGIKAFQKRHGLESDGVIGRATFEQLNVAPAARVRQIELSMERLRWTPLLQSQRMIVVNVPEFVLRAYDLNNGKPDIKLTMNVIVGKALDTATPLFDEDMRFIEFSPYWNIPISIARAETIPKLRRNPAFFEQQGLEFVSNGGQVSRTLSNANLDAVLRGQMRIRQRPGPKNALGDIKFVFPNNDNIYLHHTPAPQLFKRGRRDFSHGCIRIEEPVALARFVLRDMPEWTEARIEEAMTKGESATLRLKEPLPVLIAYTTALADDKGKVYFFADIYQRDQPLEQALQQRPAPTQDPLLPAQR